ncbi:GNAT family N-acetyltransferase [Xanthomonas sp. 3498]|uniref:GNAT family N-acetyltransferase n=1 Tax=Xanthomonas sp. 3498 TaxID=2663863 RepID=UPI00162206AF|nr:GNAT family N-acetyltransferase [Xanthomonas sp. 3498]MBB5876093.1 ribosomal protein S18 acetylase RimI-like enzyme [Xanthomonas sp. 3498]
MSAFGPAQEELRWRTAGVADQPALLAMLQAFYAEDGIAFDAERVTRGLQALLTQPALGEALLWLAPDGTVVGYALITACFSVELGGRYLLLDELYLGPDARGRGWGRRAAVALVEARARALGADVLRMEVNHHNAAAKRLYLGLGYRDDARDQLSRRLDTAH